MDHGDGYISVADLRSPAERPVTLRATPETSEGLREGAVIRLQLGQYEGEWWLDSWWPVSSAAAARLVDERWWLPLEEEGDAFPASGILGLDDRGALVNLGDEAFRLGVFIVPYGRSSNAEAVPQAIELMSRFAERLSTTPHRDLPVVFW